MEVEKLARGVATLPSQISTVLTAILSEFYRISMLPDYHVAGSPSHYGPEQLKMGT